MTTHPDNINTNQLTIQVSVDMAQHACRLIAAQVAEQAEILEGIAEQWKAMGNEDEPAANTAEWWEWCRGPLSSCYNRTDDVGQELRKLLDFIGAFVSPECWYEDNPDIIGPTKRRLDREVLRRMTYVPGVGFQDGSRVVSEEEAAHFYGDDNVAAAKVRAAGGTPSPRQPFDEVVTYTGDRWLVGQDAIAHVAKVKAEKWAAEADPTA